MNSNEEFIKQAKRIICENSDKGQFYVMVADITGFHTVNHIYGMQTGDELLAQLETAISSWPNMRLCSRVFADLFLCLYFLDDGASIDDITSDNDKKIQAFLDEWRSKYPACNLKGSCGVCQIENGDIDGCINNANAARKTTKKYLSTKAIVYDEPMREQTAVGYEAEQECYRAIRENRFCFYLQPKVDLTSGEIIGAEALARCIGQNGEMIYPDSFLEVMEKSGAVISLDRIVCRQVCVFLSDRIDRGLPVFPISVNLSRLHVQIPTAADDLHKMVTQYRVPPDLLEFELTETIFLEDFDGTKQLIDKLRAYGYKVSIDDFGAGYAGMGILQELNFDCLKMDRAFLSDEPTCKERNKVLIPNMINIAQQLHVQIVCEGVETEEQCLYLLWFGCTKVQGFFFSKPVQPEALCEIYTKQNRKFPLPPSLVAKKTKSDTEKMTKHSISKYTHRHATPYFIVILLCALFLGTCITGVLTSNRYQTQQEFTGMIIETLDAYTEGQRESTLTEISGIISTLDTMSVLFEENDNPEFIDTFLQSLNKNTPDVTYEYFSYENYKKQISDGITHPGAEKTLERLLRGETVVSEIVFSERLGDIYCMGIGVPVMKDGELIGAVRGIINARILISTELYSPAQGEISAVFLTNGDSRVIPVQKDGKAPGERLLDRMLHWGIDEETMEKLRDNFSADSEQARSLRIGIFEGSPYYISLAGLKYNDWHLVVCLKADKAFDYSQHIMQETTRGITILLIAVFLVSVVVILFVRKIQHKFSRDEQRYLILEHFSDTVLFDYDCLSDTIRYTSNSSKLFRIYELSQRKGESGEFNLIYAYIGDQEAVRQMLKGQAESPSGEIRVRLLRPDADEYFWCLIQYQYLYEKNMLVSVIGKITDIDRHMRNEERLLRMSETDGLTGLLNKMAMETVTAKQLGQNPDGTLFIIDADGFKEINDKYGHAAGDSALRFIGDCMRRTFRKGDILGRIGGDELAVFAWEINSRETAQKKAKLLQMHLATCLEKGVPPLSISIGIALAPANGDNYQDLYLAADKALYAAKKNGKCQFCFYEDIG